MPIEPAPTFTHVIELADLPREGRSFSFTALEDVFGELIRRLGVVGIHQLAYSLHALPTPDGVKISGQVSASLLRTCVITGETMDEQIEEDLRLTFVHKSGKAVDDELTLDEDWPEFLESAQLDLAEVAVQQLLIAMNPYPRKRGAIYEPAPTPPLSTSPFSALGQIKSDEPPQD